MYPNFFLTSSLFFVIIQTLIHVPTSLCADYEQYVTCGASFNCASILYISYPFWGESRPQKCGYPGFQLQNCQGDAPLITIQSAQYQVIAIGYTPPTLTVAREDLRNNTCPTHLYNTTFNSTALFSYPSNRQSVTLHYNCSTIITGQTQLLPNQFTCNSNSLGYFFLTDTTNSNSSINLGSCSDSVIVPVNQTSAQALLSATASVSNLEAALAGGFELQWSANNTECKECIESGGRCGYNSSSASFTCYCANQPHSLTCSPIQSGVSHNNAFLFPLVIVSSIVVGIIILLFVTICCLRRRWLSIKATVLPFKKIKAMVLRKKVEMNHQKVEALIRNCGLLTPKRYSYRDIEKMTKTFKDKLGQGGYGGVFKGKLSDGRVVAIKVLNEANGDGEEFINEVASISKTSHVNIVTLLGFCFEGSKRALIYEFMPNKSLDKFICNDGCRLDWKTLYQIAVGIARGLEYLHRGCNTRIVHFDIKPHNILLDEDFCPKISDFGLAKLCRRKESIFSMLGARGTPGYIAPEVFFRNFGGVSNKSDVYSYGMMVLEMVGARENVEVGVACTSEIYFPDCIFEHLELGDDLKCYGVTTEEEDETARKMILVSLWCIQTKPSDRPSMSKVVEMLEGSLQSLQIPPKPFMFSLSRPTQDSSVSIS